jgi:O-antigen ligase
VLIALMIGLGALATVVVVVPAPLFDLDRFGAVKELTLLVTAGITGILVVARADRIELGIAELCLIGFVAMTVVSGVLASNHWLALRAVSVTLAGAVLWFAARFAAVRGTRARELIAIGLVAAGLAGAVSGLLQAYGWHSSLLADTRAPGGTLGNRNFMAHLTVLGLPLAAWLASRARRGGTVLLLAAVIAAMAGAIVLSRSRAAWVGGGAALAAAATLAGLSRVTPPRLARRRAAILAGATGLGVTAALVLPNDLAWRSPSPYRDSLRDVLNYREGSGRGRLIQYQNSVKLVADNPVLGVGPGNWMVAYPLVTTPLDPSFDAADPIPTNPWPSSDWVALLAERGPVAALAWIGFLATVMVVVVRRATDPEHGAAALAVIAILAAVAVQGAFDAVLLLAAPTVIVMAALGALVPATRAVTTVAISGRRGRALLGVTLLFGLLSARAAAHLGAVIVARDGWPVRELEAALRFDPGNHRLHLLLAQRSSCPVARIHAVRAARLLPNHPWPRRLLERCR